MSLEPQSYDEFLARKKRQDKRRRKSVKRYEDKKRQAYLDGEGPYSSLSRKPKSREKWEAQYGSEERAAWIRRQPCIITGRTPCVNAHTEAGGMGMKGPPESIVPMIQEKHDELHQVGRKTFEAKYSVSLEHYAAYYAGLWEAERDG